jgi:hypothetical protein
MCPRARPSLDETFGAHVMVCSRSDGADNRFCGLGVFGVVTQIAPLRLVYGKASADRRRGRAL